MHSVKTDSSLVGGGIFNLVTAGMYSNPLTMYREYVQNAADAFATSDNMAQNRVEVVIDPVLLQVKIRDNGPGLSPDEATRALLPIGLSQKNPSIDRGFRGIGRLCGLAFAESVTFLTRSQKDQPVTRIVWRRPKKRGWLRWSHELSHMIRESVDIETFYSTEYPSHFFEVEISGVGRHAAGALLNRDAVQSYIGGVCPVPMPNAFPYASNVKVLLTTLGIPLVLNIFVDDVPAPVTRHHGERIWYSNTKQDNFVEFEHFRIPSVDGNDSAVGWVAHSSYLGMIPKDAGIRGIRARVGNIQIGDETVLNIFSPKNVLTVGV